MCLGGFLCQCMSESVICCRPDGMRRSSTMKDTIEHVLASKWMCDELCGSVHVASCCVI